MKSIFIFLSCWIYVLSVSAQLQKGDWRLGGVISFVDQQTNSNQGSLTTLVLNPKLALMITDKWMLGGELDITFLDRQARVRHGLFFRHYFKAWGPTNLFWGGGSEWEKWRMLSAGGSGPDTRFFRSHLDFGLQHLYNRNVALEILASYRFLQTTRVPNRGIGEAINRGVELSASFHLFFPSQLSKDTIKQTIDFHKGQWALGGRLSLTGNGTLLQPELARFFSKRLALGARLSYGDDFALRTFEVGFHLLARYYLTIGRKKKIFGEVATGYQFLALRRGSEWRLIDRKLVYGFALGLANMLSKNASFDLSLFYQPDRPVFDTNPLLATRQVGLRIGLQVYIGRP
ncbi:MAG: hypothetical protein AAF985_19460 [Bacteroidota bacterium]